MQNAVLATAIPSVCPSVTRWYCTQMNEDRITRSSLWGSKYSLVFRYQQWLGVDVPFHLKFALEVTHPFEKLRLRVISGYNVSTVIASEKVQLSRIGSRLRAFQRAIDEMCTLPLSPSKSRSNSEFVIFVDKNPFKSNKVCYKVSLCETSSGKVVTEPFPDLTVFIIMLAVNVTLEPNI